MVSVKTKDELKKAIKNKESTILITDKKLALKVRKAKNIRKWSKRALIASLAVFGLGAGAIFLLPSTIISAIAGGGVSSTVLFSTAAGGTAAGGAAAGGAAGGAAAGGAAGGAALFSTAAGGTAAGGAAAGGAAAGGAAGGAAAGGAAGGSFLGILVLSFWKDYEMTEFNFDTGFLKLTLKPKKR